MPNSRGRIWIQIYQSHLLEHPQRWSHNFNYLILQKVTLFILLSHFIKYPTSVVLF